MTPECHQAIPARAEARHRCDSAHSALQPTINAKSLSLASSEISLVVESGEQLGWELRFEPSDARKLCVGLDVRESSHISANVKLRSPDGTELRDTEGCLKFANHKEIPGQHALHLIFLWFLTWFPISRTHQACVFAGADGSVCTVPLV